MDEPLRHLSRAVENEGQIGFGDAEEPVFEIIEPEEEFLPFFLVLDQAALMAHIGAGVPV